MKFSDAARQYSHLTRTENGAVALSTTGSPLVDLFASIGAMRNKDIETMFQMFGSALAEDALLATKMLFYARNVRGGLGERDTFRKLLTMLSFERPETVAKNLENISYFGRFDDLYALVGTPVEEDMWSYLRRVVAQDLENLRAGNVTSLSLAGKWMKSVNASSAETRMLGQKTARALGMSDKTYRKTLSELRKALQIVERKMSANQWTEINYEQVPSNAMKMYREAFKKHDPAFMTEYIKEVEIGTKEIKAGTLFPYDILMAGGLDENRKNHFTIKNDPVLEVQWKALPNYIQGEHNILVMADTSGSMTMYNGQPIATSIGLSLYFAERNKGVFKDLMLTFSSTPQFVDVSGETLKQKISRIPAIVDNTNLESAFNLILTTAIKNNVPQEEMPVSLLVISDMQFDQGTVQGGGYWSDSGFVRGSDLDTFHEKMEQKYRSAGYEMPVLIYWNVEGRANTFQADQKKQNVILVSGQSASSFRDVLSNIGKTPYDFMVETLANPMYDRVVL